MSEKSIPYITYSERKVEDQTTFQEFYQEGDDEKQAPYCIKAIHESGITITETSWRAQHRNKKDAIVRLTSMLKILETIRWKINAIPFIEPKRKELSSLEEKVLREKNHIYIQYAKYVKEKYSKKADKKERIDAVFDIMKEVAKLPLSVGIPEGLLSELSELSEPRKTPSLVTKSTPSFKSHHMYRGLDGEIERVWSTIGEGAGIIKEASSLLRINND